MEYKSIVDVNGNLIDRCVMFIENKPQNFTLENYMLAVEYYDQQFLKPKWNGSKWIETATDEELKENEEQNQKENVEPSLEDKVQFLEDDNANLLFDLADKDIRLNQLENDFADLLLNLGGDK